MKTYFCCIGLLLCVSFHLHSHPGDGLDGDSKGNLYFTDVNTRSVWRLDPELGLTVLLEDRWAHGLCVDGLDRIWVEVEVDNTQYQVVRVETDGSVTSVLGPQERGPEFYGVSLLADDEGRLYFPHAQPPEFWGCGIRQRSPDGRSSWLAGRNGHGRRDGRGNRALFQNIRAMRFGRDDAIYVVDGDSVRRVTLDGQVSTLFCDITVEDPENQPFDNGNPQVSNRLYGLDMDDHKNIYVAYHGNRQVLKLKKSKEPEVVYSAEKPWSPVGVKCFNGALVIKETGLEPGSKQPGPRIRRLNPDGSIDTLVTIKP